MMRMTIVRPIELAHFGKGQFYLWHVLNTVKSTIDSLLLFECRDNQ